MSACFKIVVLPSLKVVSRQEAAINLPQRPVQRYHSEVAFAGDLADTGQPVSCKSARRAMHSTDR